MNVLNHLSLNGLASRVIQCIVFACYPSEECRTCALDRFHKYTVGYAWVSNYGCSDKEEEFPNLLRISPLHNIKAVDGVQHPATLIMTGDHDDRVGVHLWRRWVKSNL